MRDTRDQQLIDFLGKPEYICSIAGNMARNHALTTITVPCGNVAATIRVIARSIEQITNPASPGCLLLFDREPQDYADLEKLHHEIRVSLLATLLAHDLPDGKTRLSQADTITPTLQMINREGDDQFCGCDTQVLLGFTERTPSTLSLDNIVTFSDIFLQLHPMALPVHRKRPYFSIAISSVYTDTPHKEKVRAEARAYFGIPNFPHPRFSPISCLAVNPFEDIQKALHTKEGDKIHARAKNDSPYMYNNSQSLAKPYARNDEAFDTYVNMRYIVRCLAVGTWNDVEEKRIVQELYKEQLGIQWIGLDIKNGSCTEEEAERTLQKWFKKIRALAAYATQQYSQSITS